MTVSLSDATPNSTIYFTLDGTAPTTNSLLYTGPFMLTNGARRCRQIAAQPGAANSAIASAGFVDTSAIGHGVGLQGNYFWTNASGTAFTNINFTQATDADAD